MCCTDKALNCASTVVCQNIEHFHQGHLGMWKIVGKLGSMKINGNWLQSYSFQGVFRVMSFCSLKHWAHLLHPWSSSHPHQSECHPPDQDQVERRGQGLPRDHQNGEDIGHGLRNN